MERKRWWCVLVCGFFLSNQARSASLENNSPPVETAIPPHPGLLWVQATRPQEQQDQNQNQNQQAQPENTSRTDTSDQSPSQGSELSAGFSPQMVGDFPGLFGLSSILVPSVQTITTFQLVNMKGQVVLVRVTQVVPVTVASTVRVPVAGPGAFKIAENESPAPDNRVFLTYNFYGNVTGSNTAGMVINTQGVNFNGTPLLVTTLIPGVAAPRLDIHREVFGFEKTLLGGDASIGLRAPVFEQQGDGSFRQQDFGDLSLLFKYAFYNDRSTGNVLSAGLVLTVPTGPDIPTIAGNINPVLLQPFTGYLWNRDRLYLHGFTSLAVPTDSRDVTLLFNDFALGYWLYRQRENRFITSIAPTIEAHITTPLNHRGAADPIIVPDLAVLTGGLHFGLSGRSTMTLGVATPVTGPRVFEVEAMAQLNWRF
jgi:hypothetical protein